MSSGIHRTERDYEVEDENEMAGEDGTSCGTVVTSTAKIPPEPTAKDILQGFQWDGVSLYDHLKHILELLVATRPRNTIDYFDQFSRSIRDPKGVVKYQDRLPFAHKIIRMASNLNTAAAKVSEEEEEMSEEEYLFKTKKISSCLELADYFEQAGVGLPKSELCQIDIALRTLGQEEGLATVHFWGKIFCVDRSYIVAECELTYEELQNRLRLENTRVGEEGEEEEESLLDQPPVFGFGGLRPGNLEEEEDLMYMKLYNYKMPPLPMPKKVKKERMKEEHSGEGANKKVYYVSHEPGDDWIPLPNVTPEQIVMARKVRKYLRGYLTSPVDCFPPFPGRERELLRAQIARITAGTHVSPIGFFQFGQESEEAGEDAPEMVVNLDYEEVPYQDLLEPAFWVHHAPHILRIGRASYPVPERPTGEELGDEEDEKGKKQEAVEDAAKEEGPPLLTPLSEDVTLEEVVPWRTKGTSRLLPGAGAVALFSNLWPGAVAVCKERKWENIYLGDGVKLQSQGYSPPWPPRFLEECGEAVQEAADPTPEMEAEWKRLHKPPTPLVLPHEGEGEDEGPIYSEPSENTSEPKS